jgi:hypothetical protein
MSNLNRTNDDRPLPAPGKKLTVAQAMKLVVHKQYGRTLEMLAQHDSQPSTEERNGNGEETRRQ